MAWGGAADATGSNATFRGLARPIQVIENIVLAQPMSPLSSIILFLVFYFVVEPLYMYHPGFVRSGLCHLRNLDTRILRPDLELGHSLLHAASCKEPLLRA